MTKPQLPALITTDIVDGDAIAIGELYERSKSSFADALQARLNCGRCLREKKGSLPHGEWLPWLETNAGVLGFSGERKAQKLMRASKPNTPPVADMDESELIALSRQMWGRDPFVTANTGKIEWHTPPHLLDRAREVLGGFDFDPASSAIANANVQAARYFTAEDDALSQEWPIGRIWMNPPYSSSLMKPFCERFALEIERGSTGIALVNNATETGWFNTLIGRASAVCFLRGRVRYLNDSGEEEGAPLQGQAAIYSGPDVPSFREQFSDSGFIVGPLP